MFWTHMGERSTMSMVTQRSVQCEAHARRSFPFTAFLVIDAARVCIANAKSAIFKPFIDKTLLLYVTWFLHLCPASGQYTIL